jgi:hypothetical protein
VEDAMQRVKGPVLDAEKPLAEALREADPTEFQHLLVRMSPSGWSTVSKQELLEWAAKGKSTARLGSLLGGELVPNLHPDHPLETALRYVDRWPVIPVVSRADFRQLEGVISERDVLERYREFGEG